MELSYLLPDLDYHALAQEFMSQALVGLIEGQTVSSGAFSDRFQRIVDHLQKFAPSSCQGFGGSCDSSRVLFISPNDTAIGPAVQNGAFESFELLHVVRNLKPGNTTLDVGANIGLYTVHMAVAVGPMGHVYAFEPDPFNLAMLYTNIALNGLTNVTVIPKAVSNRTGKAFLHQSRNNFGDHSLGVDAERHSSSVVIDVDTLDNFLPPDLVVQSIKMDIQGEEVKAFQGATGVLSRSPYINLLIEYCPQMLKQAGSRRIEFFDMLEEWGFTKFAFEPVWSRECLGGMEIDFSKGYRMVPIPTQRYLERVHFDGDFSNIWCERRIEAS